MTEYSGNTVPFFFGTDENAYGVARMYYDLTGQKAIIYGAKNLSATRFSKFTDVTVIPHLSQTVAFAKAMQNCILDRIKSFKRVVLIGLGDAYAKLIREYAYFPDNVVRPYPDAKMFEKVTDKARFYQLLEKTELKPAEYIELSKNDTERDVKSPFPFPVMLKATDSVSWGSMKYPDHRKDYVLNSNEEINRFLRLAYHQGYRRNFVLQRFVAGEGQEYTFSAYVDQHHHVRGMALGHVALEDHTPWGIGNHDAIFPVQESELTDKICQFLEDIDYTGIANIVFRYDQKTQQFLALELNARLERCSYWSALNGVNWVELMLKDADDEFTNVPDDEITKVMTQPDQITLWLQVSPRVFKRYAPDSPAKNVAVNLIRQRRWRYGFKDKRDWDPQRARMYHFIHVSNRYHYETWGNVKVNPVVRFFQLTRWAIFRTINKIGPKYSLMN